MRILFIILMIIPLLSPAMQPVNDLYYESCNQSPGLADSHVLAMSWQPAFCETYGYDAGKKECLALNAASFSSHHMVLHGLWPNQSSCGQRYGFCGLSEQPRHCDYSPLELNEEVAAGLSEIMPGFALGSCLERHEWNKHGSCQFLDVNDYFALSIRLGQQVNQSEFALYIDEHRGERVPRRTLREMLVRSFGKTDASRVYLGCKKGQLVDIFFQLPALIPPDAPLTSLLSEAPAFSRPDGCPVTIKLSDFTNQVR